MEDLIRRLQQGDHEAFALMVRQNQARVYSVALGLVRQREDALDITQETFLKAFKYIKTWRGDCSLSTWLCKIASNSATDLLRKRRDIQPLEGMDLGQAPKSDEPEAALTMEEQRVLVRQAVAALPREYRELVVLRHSGDMSCQEIADSLGLSLSQVKNRLLRARQMLKAALQEKEGEVLASV